MVKLYTHIIAPLFWKSSKKQVDEKQITSSTTVEASPETVKTEIDPTEQSNNASNKSEKDLISEKLLELNQKEEELKEKEKLLEVYKARKD